MHKIIPCLMAALGCIPLWAKSGLLALILTYSSVSFASGPSGGFAFNSRGATGVFFAGGNKQVIELIGPDSVAMPRLGVNDSSDTMISLRVVPSGAAIVIDVAKKANITGVVACGVPLSDEDCAAIASACPAIKSLTLESATTILRDELADLSEDEKSQLTAKAISVDGLRSIATLQDLAYLELSGYKISRAGLEEIAKLKQLRYLYLNNSGLSDSDLGAIALLPSLERLVVENSEITGEGLPLLGPCRSLTQLSLKGSRLGGNLSVHVASYFAANPTSRLRCLCVEGCAVSQVEMDMTKKVAPFLQILTTGNEVSTFVPPQDAGPQLIRECRTVCCLLDRMFRVHLSGPVKPDGRIGLTHVELKKSDTPIGDWVAHYVGLLKGVTHLGIFGSDITDSGVSQICSLTSLEFLAIDGAKSIGDSSAEEISQLPSLKGVSLRRTKITDAGLSKIAQQGRLTTMLLDDTVISDQGAESVSKMPQIQYLSMKNCLVADRGALSLLMCPSLRFCDLRGNIGVSGETQRRLFDLNKAASASGFPKGLKFD